VHPVRQEILYILKKQGQATVSELAAHLEMAPVSVRHHLDLLIGDNLVCSTRVRRRSGAGRPQQLYALTPEAEAHFPNNYRQLANDTLYALKQTLPAQALQTIMEEMAHTTAAQAAMNFSEMTGVQRIEAVVAFLNQLGYMAEYKVDEERNVIYLHTCNCPYSELAATHPELCHMDHTLISELTGMAPERIAHIPLGDRRCTYRLPREPLAREETNTEPADLLSPAIPHGIEV
jgi:predicted ArsR family transcriptional regulator